ncbi:metalloendoproteinase 3-MMP [Ziziphus jujuba]|uniref:Metalloendoproteinase 3-MMP n=1 Tax=Ziziphus jujuba TaxID=326968 RepID=A0A6P3ZHS0_ZIZJJ|nr:metalloendoproteinase 3-MMP [Ziziphus jujuba]
MASKPFSLFVILLTLLFHVVSSKPSPYDFIKHLQGAHKGDHIQGLHDLKQYLEKFGYLDYHSNQTHANDDDFDSLLQSAVKTYQLNYHLNVSGDLDAETVSKMMMTRCGVADIINGNTRMESGKNNHDHDGHGSNSFHTVSHYSFFPGKLKWPASKHHLTYKFVGGNFPSEAVGPVSRAFRTWAHNTHFRFTHVQDKRKKADITISFNRGNHGDGVPFDGEGGTLAHAYAPTDGRFHYDADEPWCVGASHGAYDLETVALHEIGHLLGLLHSSVEGAIMYPTIDSGVTKGLHRDDIQGIKALYKK